MNGKEQYKSSKEIEFRIETSVFISEGDININYSSAISPYRIPNFAILHYSPFWDNLEINLYSYKTETQTFEKIEKSALNITILSYYETEHNVLISFVPNKIVYENVFYLGINAVSSDHTILQKLVSPNVRQKWNINVEQPKKDVNWREPILSTQHGHFYSASMLIFDPYNLNTYCFDLSKADGDWNKQGNVINELVFNLIPDWLSFDCNYSKVVVFLRNGDETVLQLNVNDDYKWIHDSSNDLLQFTNSGVCKIITGIRNKSTLEVSNFNIENVIHMRPDGWCTPELTPKGLIP